MLHEPQINSGQRIIGYALSILASSILFFSGMNKVMGAPWVVETLAVINLDPYVVIIGIIEITAVILFWIPKTMNIGFFLLCSYAGGIIATEMATGYGGTLGISVAIMIYLGTMLRKPSISGLYPKNADK